jgi:hypothetical protein
MQTTLDAVVFHQAHHRAPARLGGHHLLAHFAVIALQLAQPAGQVIHFRFAEGQRFFQLIATRAVVAELSMQLIATQTRALFRAVGAHANILQLFMQIVEQLFLGVEELFSEASTWLYWFSCAAWLRIASRARLRSASACSRRWRSFSFRSLLPLSISAESE